MPTAQSKKPKKSPRSSEPEVKKRFALPWEYIALAVVVLLIAGVRFRLRDMPLERDEGEYAYAGQLILQGVPPYQLAYNMKLPGTYAAYALIMAMFGQTAAGIHLGVILVNSASIILVFLITKRLFDATAAVVAAASFGLLSIRPQLLGLAGHATHFVTLAALFSIYLLLKAVGAEGYSLFLWSGLFSGLALLMKQPGVSFIVFAGLYLLRREWTADPPRILLLRKFAVFSVGSILPYALTCLILLRAGVFQKFWFWTVSYARAYGSEIPLSQGLQELGRGIELQTQHVAIIWLLVIFGMAAVLWDRKLRQHAIFLWGLLVFSFLAVSLGFFYRPHYFIMLYPALAIFAGVGVSSAANLLRSAALPKAATAAPVVFFALGFANALYAGREVYFLSSDHDACRKIYGTNPFPEAVTIGDYLRQNSGNDARVAVIGSEPEICFYAHRRSATGYIYTYPLVENQAYASVMQSDFIREVESVSPEFIVYVLVKASWLRRPGSDERIFRWADAYMREHYSLAGIADGGNNDIYQWGPDALAYRPRKPEVVLIYHRDR